MSLLSIEHIKFRNINAEDENGIIDLLVTCFPHKRRELIKKEFSFLNYCNPTQNYKPLGIVGLHKSKIVAYRNFVALPFFVGNKNIKVLVPNNTATHSNYRGLGILTKMNKLSFEMFVDEFSFFFNPSSNKSSSSVNLKQKWLPLGEKEYLFKPILKPTKIAKIACEVLFVKSPDFEMIKKVSKHSILLDNSKLSIDLSNIEVVKWLFSKDDYQFVVFKKDTVDLGYCCFIVKNRKCSIIHFDFIDSMVTIPYMLDVITTNTKIRSFYYFGKKKGSLREKGLLKAGFISTNYLFLRKITKKSLTTFLIRPVKENYSTSDFMIENIDAQLIENWDITKLSNF